MKSLSWCRFYIFLLADKGLCLLIRVDTPISHYLEMKYKKIIEICLFLTYFYWLLVAFYIIGVEKTVDYIQCLYCIVYCLNGFETGFSKIFNFFHFSEFLVLSVNLWRILNNDRSKWFSLES